MVVKIEQRRLLIDFVALSRLGNPRKIFRLATYGFIANGTYNMDILL